MKEWKEEERLQSSEREKLKEKNEELKQRSTEYMKQNNKIKKRIERMNDYQKKKTRISPNSLHITIPHHQGGNTLNNITSYCDSLLLITL